MFIKISSFPFKKVLIAWVALLVTLVWMVLIIAGNYVEGIEDVSKLLLFLTLFAVLFVYLSMVPHGYRVYYDADNLWSKKKGKFYSVLLAQVVLLESNQVASFSPFGGYNNCCLTFIDADEQPSCIYFYSDKIKSSWKQKALNRFITTVKQRNPDFKYEKQFAFLKIN